MTSQEEAFNQFDLFDWHDPEFQAGLAAIIRPLIEQGGTREAVEETTQKAKAFYFSSKTGLQISYPDYIEWKKNHPDSSSRTAPSRCNAATTSAPPLGSRVGHEDAVDVSGEQTASTASDLNVPPPTIFPAESASSSGAAALPAGTPSEPGSASGATEAGPTNPPSFDAIVELITKGQTDKIPGIREIPLKINEAPPTTSTLSVRPKPWEQGTNAVAVTDDESAILQAGVGASGQPAISTSVTSSAALSAPTAPEDGGKGDDENLEER